MNLKELWNLMNEHSKYKRTGLEVDYRIIRTDYFLILLFQCSTSSKVDWITNLRATPSMYKNQSRKFKVHKGYAIAYKSARDQIMNEYLAEFNKTPGIIPLIGGHSYGGCMSILAGEDFNYHTGLIPLVRTFGAPPICFGRQTKKLFASIMDIKQYINNNDLLAQAFFYFRQINPVYVGESFNIFSLLFNQEWHHTSYGISLDHRRIEMDGIKFARFIGPFVGEEGLDVILKYPGKDKRVYENQTIIRFKVIPTSQSFKNEFNATIYLREKGTEVISSLAIRIPTNEEEVIGPNSIQWNDGFLELHKPTGGKK